MSKSILERKVIHPGKAFIKAGEENARAYLIQNGEVRGFFKDGDQEIEIGTFGPGHIIGEVCLMSDEPLSISYEAITDTTVAMVTRAEFQKKVARVDENIFTILEHIAVKLNRQAKRDIDAAKKLAEVDPDARKMLGQFLSDIPEQNHIAYENAVLPHLNAMVKSIKRVKAEMKGES
jgi:CRP-like cAMP-binding protein